MINNPVTPSSARRQRRSKPAKPNTEGGAPEGCTGENGTIVSKAPAGPTTKKRKFPKAECVVELANGRKVHLSSVRNDVDAPFVVVRQSSRLAVTHYAAWHNNGGDGAKALAEQGIIIVADIPKVRTGIAGLTKFSLYPVITQPGWAGPSFALTTGKFICPAGTSAPLKAYAATDSILSQAGSLKAWISGVAAPLADHAFASFFMMIPFAGPLLRETDRVDNIGFELSGRGGIGKTSLLALMASTSGRAVGGQGFTYWRTCNATINAIETTMLSYNDLTLILDEAGLAEGARKATDRAATVSEMAFRLSAGNVKNRMNEARSLQARFGYVVSTNRPLNSLLGAAQASEADAINDRLINTSILEEREFGVFDYLPDGYSSMTEFVSTLKQAAAENYGHAMIRYLRFLVKHRAIKPGRIRRFVAKTIRQFIKYAGVDANDGSQRRVAEAFAIVAAGGLLAKRAGVLPANYRPMRAALEALALHRDHGRTARTFDDRLRALMRHPDTIDCDTVDPLGLTPEKLKEPRCYLRTDRSGARYLLVPKRWTERFLPGWNIIRHDSDVGQRLVRYEERIADRHMVAHGIRLTSYKFNVSDLGD